MAQQLDALPGSGDEYWEHADVNKIILPDSPGCKHSFVRTKGNEAECIKCKIGYYLSPGFEVKQEHIYQHDTLVI